MNSWAASITGLVVLAVTGLALETAARRGHGPATAAQAIGAAMRTLPGRAMILMIWLWLGVHFLAR